MYESVAEIYDGIYSKKNYELEVAQIFELLSTKPESILDIGCGTGGHAEFFATEVAYEGIDISGEMIAKANQKKIQNAEFFNVHLSKVENKNYDAVVSLFNVVNHIHSLDELLIFFHDVYKVSSPESEFIFDAWNGYASMIDPPKTEVRNIGDLKIEIMPRLDPLSQSVTMKYIVDTIDGVQWSDKLKMTLWTPKVICDCLKIVGYSVRIYKGFGKDNLEDASSSDYKILFHCTKEF